VPAEVDCVIVGAGLTGSVAALELAARGLSVMLIEQRAPLPSPRLDQRALVLSCASVRILEACGLWARLAPFSTAVRSIRISERGAIGTVRLEAAEVGLDALGWACPAGLMLSEFNSALLDHAGIDVKWSTRFLGCSTQPAAIQVRLGGPQGREDIAARLLVGADGAESAVRSAAGIEVRRFDYMQQAIVASVHAARPAPHTAFEIFTTEGPLALIPQGGARYVAVQCFVTDRAMRVAELDDRAYLALLERRSGARLGSLSELGPRRVHDLVRQRVDSLTGMRTVIIGNAANTVHPNAAQGLNLGLRDAAQLGAIAAGAIDPGAADTLDAYAAARARDHRRTSGLTHALARTFASQLAPVACARRTLLAICAHAGPMRRRVIAEFGGFAALADSASR
jgi:2-octaprenyl-6-methoxyphenol hydroxylase